MGGSGVEKGCDTSEVGFGEVELGAGGGVAHRVDHRLHFVVEGEGEVHTGDVDATDFGEVLDECEALHIGGGVVAGAALAPARREKARPFVLAQGLGMHGEGCAGIGDGQHGL